MANQDTLSERWFSALYCSINLSIKELSKAVLKRELVLVANCNVPEPDFVGASSYPDHSTGPLCYKTFDMAPALFVTSKVMRPQVSVRYVDNVAILDLAGRFVDTLSISDTVKGLIDKSALNILVNLEKATLIGNGTTGELVFCWVTAKKSGGTLKILNPDKDEKNWLEVCKLDTVLDIYYDEQSAVLSFR